MNIVALIQARVSSTRPPGKVLAHVAGSPMLRHVVDRTRRTARCLLVELEEHLGLPRSETAL